jgi:hypothetical protein
VPSVVEESAKLCTSDIANHKNVWHKEKSWVNPPVLVGEAEKNDGCNEENCSINPEPSLWPALNEPFLHHFTKLFETK